MTVRKQPKPSILLIDDVEYIRENQKKILRSYGFTSIFEAEDGVSGLQKINTRRFDIIVLDISMPRKNGVETLREIMQSPSPPTVIMCSAVRDEDIIQSCYQLGAAQYIIKPFTSDEFIQAVKIYSKKN